jgi:AcrR family transcriptional regulator
MSRSNSQPESRSSGSSVRADGARSRERILDAAEQLLSERGYAGTGISAISEASGLPASSIYWHFENKEDLVTSAVERASAHWISALEATEPGPEASSEELMAWVARSTEEMGRRLPFFLRISLMLGLELGHREPALLARLRQGRERSHALVQRTLDRMLASDGDPVSSEISREMAHLTLAFSEGAFVARIFEPEAIDPVRLAEDIEVAMRAISAKRRAEASS